MLLDSKAVSFGTINFYANTKVGANGAYPTLTHWTLSTSKISISKNFTKISGWALT
jgi:hypothetical protein